MLTDSFGDFTTLVKEPGADLPALLADLEADLHHYAGEFWGYNRQVFPPLRKAARWYVAGKLSWRALNAISLRLIICYMANGEMETEESLVEDLRAYVRVKPTIDLRTKVGRICRRNRTATKAEPLTIVRQQELPMQMPGPLVSAKTSTGVVLQLVR